MKATYALLAGLTAQQAVATWDYFGKPFKSPPYANNECSDKQKGGFDWSDLKDGDSNFQYGDFDFSSGWKCSNSFGKRDSLTKRTFGNKAITNKCSKDKPATFGCDKRKDGFSITTIDVSVEFDVEIDLHYKMNDGSLCKQKSVPCKKSGNTVQNTQCGGAQSVEVYLGSGYKGSKSDCQIGFHHIGFDCNPPTEYKPPPPPSPPSRPPPSSSKPVVSRPVSTPPPVKSSAPPCYGGDCGGKPPASTPVAPPPSPPSCSEGYGGEGCPSGSTPPASTPPAGTPPASTPPAGTPPASKPPVQTPPPLTRPPFGNSSIPAPPPPTYETTKIPPPNSESIKTPPSSETTKSPPPGSSVVVPPPSYETSAPPCNGEYCGASSAPPSSPSAPPSKPGVPASSAPASTPSSPPPPPPPVGEVLPTCMNTWLQISTEDCKDNTAVDCYCKNSKFTKNVIDCVQAWCKTDEETKQTLQYLVGICAQYVPENPGLVSDCPEDTFQPPATPTGGPRSSGAPVTTPAPPMPSGPVTTIVYGSTSVTVPQVHFSTETYAAGATPVAPVGLVVGTAPPQAAVTPTQAPFPIPSTLRPSSLPTGTGAIRPSSPAQFTGAASPFKAEAKHVMLGAAIAFLAL
ncbi:hypothetical protein GQ44DRAFT_697260 [Phaeosphaeriaceae sp. PMI808]|nr:hypothetical protein GQ44DRAFT_697260 [Phaeosphaeriaceae sp. PMI808]